MNFKRARIWLFAALVLSQTGTVFAEAAKFSLLGGLSSPAPGVLIDGSVCKKIGNSTCIGGSYALAHNSYLKDGETVFVQHATAMVEQSFGIGDPYHILWSQGNAGLAYVQRTQTLDGSTSVKNQWAPSVGVAFGGEFPIADLVGVRLGVSVKKAVAPSTPTQIGLLGGVRFGAEWLGFGD